MVSANFARIISYTPPFARDPLWLRARALPSLDLDFATTKSLIDRISGQNLITFTRSSTATYVGSNGLIQTAAINEPRYQHDPITGRCLGLLVEESRTNSIRNNTMVGAVAGTPGTLPTNWLYAVPGAGLTRSVVGSGVENGISYVDIRVNGTAASVTAVSIGIDNGVAAVSQTWTSSAYLKLAGGSTAGILSWNILMAEFDAGNAFLAGADYPVSTPSGSLVRSEVTRTLTAGATASVTTAIRIFCTNGAAIDFTLRIGLPQLEQGAFATSPILTSGTSSTRSADIATISGSNFSRWYRQDEGTVFAEYLQATPIAVGCVGFDDTTNAERWHLGHSGTTAARLIVVNDSSLVVSLSGQVGNAPLNIFNKMIAAVKLDDFAVLSNGTSATTSAIGSMPTVSRAQIGISQASSLPINGLIKRITYWPQRLPNPTLQALTR